ncbi:hypothetical protein HDU98_009329 [Podochytrium sp. JEL0797]|nr:hypothetical protein HDU98_009329 [Podochytrium sp. JEL0797]
MKVASIIAATALAVSVSASAFNSAPSPLAPIPNNLLWPRPQHFTHGSSDRTFGPTVVDITIVAVNGNQAMLERAARRFRKNVLAVGCDNLEVYGDITRVSIHVTGKDPKDLADMDESYSLTTDENSVSITANHSVGALRAMETLAQLVKPIEKLPFHVQTDAEGCAASKAAGFVPGFVIPAGPWSITDSPSYEWRGVMLDTSRNFIPVPSILRTLDGMSATKLNVFHWHMVDATAFPAESKTYPDLANSAYSKLSIYSHQDMRDVIEYAADRGIRVIAEFDTPAHAYALKYAKDLEPLIICQNGGADGTNSFFPTCVEPPCGNVNMADPRSGPAIGKLIAEYADIFPDRVMHLGGDELQNFCLGTTDAFMDIAFPGQNKSDIFNATSNLPVGKEYKEGLAKVYQPYIDHLHAAVGSKTGMHWEDCVLHDGIVVEAGSIIQVWNSWHNDISMNSMQQVLNLNSKGAGYKIVDSSSDYYYLDGGSGAWLTDRGYGTGDDAWMEKYWTDLKNWQRVYVHDPRHSVMENNTAAGVPNTDGLAGPLVGDLSAIIGAESTIWCERISDSNLDVKLWPRAAAAAEALWSSDVFADPGNKDFFEALPRLEVFRDRLLSRGFGAETLQPYWCRNNGCGSEFSGYGPDLAYGNKLPTAW